MIELKNDSLVFSFRDVHPSATLSIDFQRTLRIPDDDKTYALPPGLGRFPLRHVDDHAKAVRQFLVDDGNAESSRGGLSGGRRRRERGGESDERQQAREF